MLFFYVLKSPKASKFRGWEEAVGLRYELTPD